MRASLGPPTARSLHMTVRVTDELSTQPRATQRGFQDDKGFQNTLLSTSPRCAALIAAPSPSCGHAHPVTLCCLRLQRRINRAAQRHTCGSRWHVARAAAAAVVTARHANTHTRTRTHSHSHTPQPHAHRHSRACTHHAHTQMQAPHTDTVQDRARRLFSARTHARTHARTWAHASFRSDRARSMRVCACLGGAMHRMRM